MEHRSTATLLLVGALAFGTNGCGDDAITKPASSAPPPATTSIESSAESSTESATTSPLVVTEFEGGATYLTGRLDEFVIDEGTLETDANGLVHFARRYDQLRHRRPTSAGRSTPRGTPIVGAPTSTTER